MERREIEEIDFLSEIVSVLNVGKGEFLDFDKVLGLVCNFTGMHESYLVEITHDKKYTIRNQWRKDEKKLYLDPEKVDDFLFDAGLVELLEKQHYLFVEERESERSTAVKGLMLNLKLKSCLMIPLHNNGNYNYFICFARHDDNYEIRENNLFYLFSVSKCIQVVLDKQMVIEKMERNHLLYQDFIENRKDFMVRLDSNLKVCYGNKLFYKLLKKDAGEVVGLDFVNLTAEVEIPIPDLISLNCDVNRTESFITGFKVENELIFIDWMAYAVKIDRELTEIHLVGNDVTKFHKKEAIIKEKQLVHNLN